MEYTLMDLNINIEEHFKQTNDDKSQVNSSNVKQTNDNNFDLTHFGVGFDEFYGLARNFVKEKEGKAFHFSYQDRNMLNALAKQVHYGKYQIESDKNVGFLDLVGKDRLQIWKSLGEMTKEEAMRRYICLILKLCPLFHTSMEAHKRHLEEELRKKQIEEEKNQISKMSQQRERKLKDEEFKFQEENKKKREEIQKKQIQEALNQQTFPHFKAYAEQQHPNNQNAQTELIKQLQEQHFEQYMNQVYQQQLFHQQQQAEQLKAIKQAQKNQKKQLENQQTISIQSEITNEQTTSDLNNVLLNENANGLSLDQINLNSVNGDVELNNSKEKNDSNDEEDEVELPPISAATMLTRKDIKEFKEVVRKDNDSIIKVGSGETVTVRVPTHEDGRLLFWEFATDYYDLGFGLYFEWTISPSNNVTVHVSDSSEDEEGDEEGGEKKTDIEKGKANSNKPPCDEIIPIFRRDCHEEVYAGSHIYPGRGVYLLKFDNSYSLWRSKTLYYRVYYSK